MIRDLIRTACVLVTMAVAASLIVEVRLRLAAIDAALRQTHQPATYAPISVPAAPQSPGRLRAVGRAVLDLADATIGVVR
jgi:hypothetical protein